MRTALARKRNAHPGNQLSIFDAVPLNEGDGRRADGGAWAKGGSGSAARLAPGPERVRELEGQLGRRALDYLKRVRGGLGRLGIPMCYQGTFSELKGHLGGWKGGPGGWMDAQMVERMDRLVADRIAEHRLKGEGGEGHKSAALVRQYWEAFKGNRELALRLGESRIEEYNQRVAEMRGSENPMLALTAILSGT